MKKLLILTTAIVAAGWTHAAILTELDGTNVVGYVPVTVATSGSTIVSPPFERCLGNGAAGMLSALVATNGLVSHADNAALADQVVVLTTNDSGQAIYYYYWYKTGFGWETNYTVKIDGTSTNTVEAPAATNYPLSRGLGVWLKRAPSASGTTVYLKGQIPVASQAITLKGNTNFTLIGLGAFTVTNINQVAAANWGARYDGPASDDADKLLVVTNANGTYVTYYYYAAQSKWVDKNGNDPTVAIQPGQGFWFLRRGETNLVFTPVLQ